MGKGHMKNGRRIETTIETHQVWIVRRQASRRGWCVDCAEDPVVMLTPEEAAALAGVSLRAIYRSVEEGRTHFQETPDGRLLVCLASISAPTG